VLLGFLLDVTDLLRDLLQRVFVVRVLNLQVSCGLSARLRHVIYSEAAHLAAS
jgi:hypothetical protein